MNNKQLKELLISVVLGKALDFDQLAQQNEPIFKLLNFKDADSLIKSIKTYG